MPRTPTIVRACPSGVLMAAEFVHLHLHSEYSMLDSTVRIPQLLERSKQQQMPAVALTDQNNLFGLVKFYRKAIAAAYQADYRSRSYASQMTTMQITLSP